MPAVTKKLTGRQGNGGRVIMERAFLRVLLVAKKNSRFSVFVAELQRRSAIELVAAQSGAEGLQALQGQRLDLVVADEQLGDMSGVAFVKQLVKVNPLVNTAIVGTLAEHEFHEATEGLGVLMQLPAEPKAKDAEALLAVLERIGVLLQPAAPPQTTPGNP